MKIDLSNRNISTLDGYDLTGVTHLYCGNNQLTSLPTLPSTLTLLECSNNQLTSLPILPAQALTELYCENNQLTSLPTLQSSITLIILYCNNNQLSSLPTLPGSLIHLYCNDNQLTSLPILPAQALTELGCWNNKLVSLPRLPKGLKKLECDEDVVKTLNDLKPFNCRINDEPLNRDVQLYRYNVLIDQYNYLVKFDLPNNGFPEYERETEWSEQLQEMYEQLYDEVAHLQDALTYQVGGEPYEKAKQEFDLLKLNHAPLYDLINQGIITWTEPVESVNMVPVVRSKTPPLTPSKAILSRISRYGLKDQSTLTEENIEEEFQRRGITGYSTQ